LSIFLNDHELTLPQFLVVWNLEVASFTLSYLKDRLVSLEVDVYISQLLSVNVHKGKAQRFLGNLLWVDVTSNLLHVRLSI
jgi:hypothetical protein